MSTSASDHDMSDSTSSPMYKLSPCSSPSQQVPQLTNGLHELTCVDKKQSQLNKKPWLRIIEQPQDHFRFRYASEMVGTHGCLLGKNSGIKKGKSHPAVELMNYSDLATIKCCLAQVDRDEEHPHKLLEEDQDREMSYDLPVNGSYKVAFGGIGIIHTAKKDVPGLLFTKLAAGMKTSNYNPKDLRARCDQMAKSINLNIVRLKFTAYNTFTGEELCEPVFSEPIHNMKSAQTNDLKICRISCTMGKASGGDDVFILVEKVNKKNIMIRFFELDEKGQRGKWNGIGHFMPTDVHHQYAIVFRTPPYKDVNITHDAKVYIELVRTTDGRTSEPKEFIYKKNKIMQMKKRKIESSLCSSSSSSGSLLSASDIPVPVNQMAMSPEVMLRDVPMEPQPIQYNLLSQVLTQNQCDLGSALYSGTGSEASQSPQPSPMWTGHSMSPAEISYDITPHINSTELDDILNNMLNNEGGLQYFSDVLKNHGEVLPEKNSMEFIRALLVPDSGRGKKVGQQVQSSEQKETNKDNCEYTAYYSTKDGLEVKEIVEYLCEVIKNKRVHKRQEIRDKLERLFEIRLSNGDTFLHMTLCSKPSSLDYMLKLISSVKSTHLFDCVNEKQQTVLHLAVMHDLPKIVSLLVSKGANPMMKDEDDMNAIHYAVKYGSCLDELLEAIKKYKVLCDLNEYNNEKQSALHMAVVSDRADAVTSLLSAGASYCVRDAQGRTPLHLAAYDARLHVTRALLAYIPASEIDMTDGAGNTALQIVCGGAVMEHTIDLAVLLLEKKANPILKHEEGCDSAWKLVKNKPELREAMRKYVIAEYMDEENMKSEPEEDIKSEPEDDFESADEGDGIDESVPELAWYVREVSALLDVDGAWRELARRLRLDSLADWYAAQPSPTNTLLNYIKDSGEIISSRSLALTLEDMGQNEAAKIIRQFID